MTLDHHNNHNVDAFTPRDYQVELLATSFEKNIVVCVDNHTCKDFISVKLITEIAPELRDKEKRQVALYVLNDMRKAEGISFVTHLTDLQVAIIKPEDEDLNEWKEKHVLISDPDTFLKLFDDESLSMDSVAVILLDNCHLQMGTSRIETIIEKYYVVAERKPKIFGLSEPIHGSSCPSSQLEAKLQYLEQCLRAKIETANETHQLYNRASSKLHEFIIQNPMPKIDPLTNLIIELVLSKIAYLDDHRFDPLEIYSDEFVDDWKNVPDPKVLPLSLLHEFLDILIDLGAYTAKKSAIHFIAQIEKFKIKTAYERHFLLLSLVSTTLHQIRMACDHYFKDVTFRDQITNYTTPKVQNLLAILKQFKPKEIGEKRNKGQESVPKPAPELKAIETGPPSPEESREIKELNSLDFKNLIETIEEVKEKKSSEGESEIEAESNEVKTALKSLTTNSNNQKPTEGKLPRPKRRFFNRYRGFHNFNQQDSDALGGIIFCDSKNIAKALFSVVNEASSQDPDLKYLNVQYTTEKCQSVDVVADVKEIEAEHRKQEEVLKRFRNRECNLLISTSMLESGIDLPKCNLVIRWTVPKTYKSYMQTKGKANCLNSFHLIMVSPVFPKDRPPITFDKFTVPYHEFLCTEPPTEEEDGTLTIPETTSMEVIDKYFLNTETVTTDVTEQLAEYFEVEKILVRNHPAPKPGELNGTADAERYNQLVVPYKASVTSVCSATLLNSIHLINNYCAKLPSDTFTKLVPLVRYAQTRRGNVTLYQCTIRLPINSPLKCDIVGLPAPTKSLAGRIAALIGCKMLHRSGELDDNLQPIGKEEFRASEVYFKNFELDQADTQLVKDNVEPRPGTTKRRQYYYKKVAAVLKNCRPSAGVRTYLYHIRMILKTPIPEEQNTRGRRIFAPEDCPLGFGILTTKKIPTLCSFPIFTRSGEIEISLELVEEKLILQEEEILKLNHFIRYTFTNVLRLQKYLMFFDETATENCVYIAPTIESPDKKVSIDWNFLEVIYGQPNVLPKFKSDEDRKDWKFDDDIFQDAVVMPWYRNQDQPQYFYVAEICKFLSPESSFPGTSYTTFKEYYFKKYGIEVQNIKQPLLDVDHTSARLNFLTPRYVNRKGVALPTSSEETKRAKRENLEEKQILIPELCTIHPFPASLWRAAVCLPCILYRINALLLADEIRIQVAVDLGLGQLEITKKDFQWPILNFGWSLHELMKSNPGPLERRALLDESLPDAEDSANASKESTAGEEEERKSDDNEEEDKEKDENELEIGMWNNEMAKNLYGPKEAEKDTIVRYGSPTQWNRSEIYTRKVDNYFSDSDSDASDPSDDNDEGYSTNNHTNSTVECFDRLDEMNLRIKFESNNVAEAFESEATIASRNKLYMQFDAKDSACEEAFAISQIENSTYFKPQLIEQFEERKRKAIDEVKETILIKSGDTLDITGLRTQKKCESEKNTTELLPKLFPYLKRTELEEFLRANNLDQESPKLTIDHFYDLNELYLKLHPGEQELYEVSDCGDVFDRFLGSAYKARGSEEKEKFSIEFTRRNIEKRVRETTKVDVSMLKELIVNKESSNRFSFDYQPDLTEHPGPSPSIILQALTMSNANDGINLERLETIGDSFLKFAITTYLYCSYEHVHEGKLSHLRSKYVSNLNLYRLGRLKNLGELMISTKFEPHDNWLPPCYYTPKGLEKVLIDAQIPIFYWNLADLRSLKEKNNYEICDLILKRAVENGFVPPKRVIVATADHDTAVSPVEKPDENVPCFIPCGLVNQRGVPDKSIADCMEALIGSYLIECGPRGALLFMSWAGICVLPHDEVEYAAEMERYPGSGELIERDGKTYRRIYGSWKAPRAPSLDLPDRNFTFNYELEGFCSFEEQIGYKFNDPLYLLQAMTHASYSPNRLTDCYQRLEFLGDAVLDYLIARHLFEDPGQRSPGALTDLRSALVNNTIFASLAVRHGFHKHFRHLSPGLHEVIDRFVRIQHENGYALSEECYLILEDETEEAEDVEVPKALGDLFESVAGAIFLDSGMSLDAVWNVYEKIMRPEIEKFSNSVPKSPIRELLELEPETAKFGKPEKLADGRRVRVVVEIFGKGTFHGIGRNYRIAKCTAAKCALRHLKRIHR